MQCHPQPSSSSRHGFSLVEMLTVVAIIAVLAAVGVAMLGNFMPATQDAQHHRNAQNIVAVFEAGRAAGVPWESSSLEAALQDVIQGRTVTGGALNGVFFAFPEPDAEAVKNAKKYIRLESGRMTYYP